MNTKTLSFLIFVLGILVGSLLAARLLMVSDGDPSIFAAFGSDAIEITAYAEERLGRRVELRRDQGHDGKFYFIQANDPLILNPEQNASVLDRPVYRSQRMLYPLLAGGGGLFGPDMVLWGLLAVNVIALGVGTWAVARIGTHHGLSPFVGLSFGLNFGLFSEIFIDGAGVLAFALAALGALALEKGRVGAAAVAFVGAALTREVMLLFVGSIALVWWIRKKKVPWTISIPPVLAVVLWAVYLRIRIDFASGLDQVEEISIVPFSGLWAALTSGRAAPSDYLVIGVMVVLMILVSIRAWRSRVHLSWGAIGFALLGPFLTQQVWQRSFDISRALAPLLTVFVLEFFMARRRTASEQPRETVSG